MFKLNRTDGELLITYINYGDPTLLLAGVTGVKKTTLCGWRWLEMPVCVCNPSHWANHGKTLCLDQVTQWTMSHNLLLWACKRTPVFKHRPITPTVALSLTSPFTCTHGDKKMDKRMKGRQWKEKENICGCIWWTLEEQWKNLEK